METSRPKNSSGGQPRRADPRRSWAVKLADLVDPCIAPVIAKQGFGASDIIMNWPEIVGVRLAAVCEPVRLQWPPRKRDRLPEVPQAATLIVRVEGAFALELQHLASVVIERANARLGWRCVEKLALRQGPMLRQSNRTSLRPTPSPAAVAHASERVGDVENDALREALVRLGAHVLSAKRR